MWGALRLHSQLRQLCRCSAAAAAALPACSAWLSTSQALRQQPQPQLMRMQQQQQQGESSSTKHTSLWTVLGAGGAAAAAGWAAWSYSDRSNSSSSGQQIDPARLAHAAPRAQAAVAAACAGPVLHLQHSLNPTPAQLQGIAAVLEAESTALGPELVTGLWGLAMFGAVLPQQQLARLAGALTQQLAQLPVYDAVVASWAVITLCNNSSSSSNSGISSAAWQQLLQRLQAAHHREFRNEAALLYLLHAAMQQAAAAAPLSPAAPAAAAAVTPSVARLPSASAAGTSSSSSSGDVSTSEGQSEGHSEGGWQVSSSSAADQPHPSLPEVLAVVGPLHGRIKKRLAAAYQEYVPFQPYVEGPLLVVLHIAKTLPRYISAAATAAAAATAGGVGGGAGAGSGPSPLAAVFGGLSASDAQAAARMIADPGSLGKLKRDLYFRWRADELLDRHQQAVNQVAHVLYRRMQLPIQQGTDADVVLPSLRTAVFVVDDSQLPLCQQQQQQQPGGQPCLPSLPQLHPSSSSSSSLPAVLMTPLAASPPSPFTAAFWVEAHVGLQQLMRNRYSAPPGGFASRDCQGLAQAKAHCLQQRGWSVLVLTQSEVEAALGGFKAGRVKVGESYDYRGLERVLRGRLGL